jgi:hypothetical protein
MKQKNIFGLEKWEQWFESQVYKEKMGFLEDVTENFETFMGLVRDKNPLVGWNNVEVAELEKIEGENSLPRLDQMMQAKFDVLMKFFATVGYKSSDRELRRGWNLNMLYLYYGLNSESSFPVSDCKDGCNWVDFYKEHEAREPEDIRRWMQANVNKKWIME